jgi:hypothetical protein
MQKKLHINTNSRKIRVNIDTRFRNNKSQLSTDCTINLYEKFKNIISIDIPSVELSNTIYVFNEANNNISFTIKDSFGSHEIDIMTGNYTSIEMEECIQEKLDEINTTHSVNYSICICTRNGKTTIYEDSGTLTDFELIFKGGKNYSNGLGHNLGYKQKEYIDKLKYESENIVDLCGEKYLFLSIGDFQSNYKTFRGDYEICKNIFSKLLLNGDIYSVIYETNDNKLVHMKKSIDVNKLQIQLFDCFGDIVDLNGHDFSFTVELEQITNSCITDKYGSVF